MIALIASGADNNASASSFVGIPQPVGILNGDLLIIAIAIPATGVTVTPPTSDWTQLAQTDPTLALGLAVFWKTALNEPSHWVFALSGSLQASGGIIAYRNTDSFSPIEVCATVLSTGTSHAVSGVTASLAGEELVLLAAANSGVSFSGLPAGAVQLFQRNQTASSLLAAHQPLQNAGAIAATTITTSASASAASALLVLAPSYGASSFQDAYDRVVRAMPPGIDQLLDFSSGGDFFNFFWVLGSILKIFHFDLIDLLRLEAVPHLSRYRLPDWEALFGLRGTRLAQFGTIPQRQAQVLAAWRAAAGQGSSIPTVQSVLAPILGYNSAANVQVIECSRTALDTLHSYSTGSIAIGTGSTTPPALSVPDGGIVSTGGARVQLSLSAIPSAGFSVTLTSPASEATQTWTPSTNTLAATMTLYGANFVGVDIDGAWTLSLSNPGSSLTGTATLIVEGVADNENGTAGPAAPQETGAAIFDWGVYADPAHLGENGTPADFTAARRYLHGLAQAHTIVNLIQSLTPYPDVTSGIHAAIPDECCPV